MTEKTFETEEVHNIGLCSLVSTPFAIRWSYDHHISVVTEEGIHVFELIASPMCTQPSLKFARSFLYTPNVIPSESIKEEVDRRLWDMERMEIYSLLMDEAVTPQIEDTRCALPRVLAVEWSPKNLIHPGQCLLAVLTTVGAIEFFRKVSTNWIPICNLSGVWLQVIQEKIKSELEGKKDEDNYFQAIRSAAYSLQACAMAWSELLQIESTSYAYMVVAYRNKTIAIWKVPKIAESEYTVTPEIALKFSLHGKATVDTLQWIHLQKNKHLIVIGHHDGYLRGYAIEEKNGSLVAAGSYIYYEHADRIRIGRTIAMHDDPRKPTILASKGSNLVLLHLTDTGSLVVKDLYSVRGFEISGLTSLGCGRALVTTQNSVVFIVETWEKIRRIDVNVESWLSRVGTRCLGLGHSPSGIMLVNVSSPSTAYDHLVMREPSKLHIFSLKGELWDPLIVLRQSSYPTRLWDCLELVRTRAMREVEFGLSLPALPADLEGLSTDKLRISMWLSVIGEVSKKKRVIQGIESIVGEISEAQPLIFVRTACSYLERLLRKGTLTKEQRVSMYLLRMYLEVYLAGEDNDESMTIRQVQEVLERTSSMNFAKVELCDLCGEVIKDLSWDTTKCPSGHKLPRCAMTLLQVTMVKYRTCPICGLIFHPWLDEEFEEVRCLFCDVPALYDTRVLEISNPTLKEKKERGDNREATSKATEEDSDESSA